MSSGRPLLAARTSSGEGSKDGTSPAPSRPPPPGGRPKRTLIESACSACRRRKSRCDGMRPTCSRCQNLRTDCQYEAEEGESRWSALRRRNQVLESERDQLRELMAYVQTRPEHEAQDIFQRIRQCNYDDLFILLRQIKEGAMGIPPSLGPIPMPAGSPPPPVDQRLPPIQAILDVPGRGLTPTHMSHQPSMGSEDSRNSSTDMNNYPPGHPQHRSILDTLEPSLRQQPPQMNSAPTLSSEESTGSMSSTSMGPLSSMDPQNPQRPYHTP